MTNRYEGKILTLSDIDRKLEEYNLASKLFGKGLISNVEMEERERDMEDLKYIVSQRVEDMERSNRLFNRTVVITLSLIVILFFTVIAIRGGIHF